MKIRSKVTLALTGGLVAVAAIAIPAQAGTATCDNHSVTWETDAGSQVHGYVQICASKNDGGLHAKQGYQRFTRQSGPSLDTGRKYTSVATSKSDSSVRYRSDWVWDSALWGDSYVTHHYYGFTWF